jgi:hypothetical protein
VTSLNRRRRKKAEKKHVVAPRRDAWWQYGSPAPPAPPARPQDTRLIAELESAIGRHLDLSGIDLEQVAGTKSVAFSRKQQTYRPLVYVFANEAAQVHGVGRIPGDFRVPGEHWRELRDLLARIQGGLAPKPKSYDLLRTSAASLPSGLAALASEASVRIRADLRVFPCPVMLESEEYQVRFEPIRRFPRLLLPFRVKRPDEPEIETALDLASTADPIAVAFEDSANESAVIEAWPVALTAFADLIGAHAADNGEQALESSKEPTPGPGARRSGETSRRLTSTPQTRSRPHSKRLKPVGETAHHHGTFVVGHRRHLPPGQTCNDEARAAAQVYGIDLAPGWTWVQPHERGTPESFVLRFVWQVPPQLATREPAALAVGAGSGGEQPNTVIIALMAKQYRALISIPIAADSDAAAARNLAAEMRDPNGSSGSGHVELVGEVPENGLQIARVAACQRS